MRFGLWAKLKPGGRSLYAFLMYESERRSTREFPAKDADIAKVAAVKARTLCNARKKLAEYGLIRYVPQRGNVYVYTICDPEMRSPYPGDPKVPIRYVRKQEDPKARGNGLPLSLGQVAQPASTSEKATASDAPLSSYGLPGVFGDARAASLAELKR
jgi:hypothetical protein